jgi:hypothetical protein
MIFIFSLFLIFSGSISLYYNKPLGNYFEKAGKTGTFLDYVPYFPRFNIIFLSLLFIFAGIFNLLN